MKLQTIYKKTKTDATQEWTIGVDCNDQGFGFRSGMRLAMLQTICEDELKLNDIL